MDYKSYFEIPDHLTYINTAGNGLMPTSHHSWRRNRELAFFDPYGDLRDQQAAFMLSVKEGLGRLFNCPVGQIYAVPNFSFGYNTVLEGLPKDTHFLLIDDEYPSLNYPIKSRGFSYSAIETSSNLEERILAEVRNQQPDALVLSIVNYINGLKIDLNLFKQLRAEFPDLLLIADATQFMGTEPFDFLNSGFDVVAGSGYKWMMAGFGNGYVMLSARMKDLLFQDAQQKERPSEAMWSSKSILDTFFEPGHQDTLSHGTLLESVKFLEYIGLSNIQEHLSELKEYAVKQFLDRDLLLPLIANRKVKSTLFNIQIDPKHYPQLLSSGIKCFPRGSGIRIALHLYNTYADVDQFINIVDKIKNDEL